MTQICIFFYARVEERLIYLKNDKKLFIKLMIFMCQ